MTATALHALSMMRVAKVAPAPQSSALSDALGGTTSSSTATQINSSKCERKERRHKRGKAKDSKGKRSREARGSAQDDASTIRRSASSHSLEDAAFFDLELEDGLQWSPTASRDVRVLDRDQLARDAALIGTMCSASSIEEERIVRQVRRTVAKASHPPADVAARLQQVAHHLRRCEYDAEVCASRHSARDVLRCPKHVFLKIKNVGSGSDVVVDLNFRAPFAVARATAHYAALFDVVPATFVGNESTLKCLVNFMADQLRRNFDQGDMPCPPWRERSALLNTWAL